MNITVKNKIKDIFTKVLINDLVEGSVKKTNKEKKNQFTIQTFDKKFPNSKAGGEHRLSTGRQMVKNGPEFTNNPAAKRAHYDVLYRAMSGSKFGGGHKMDNPSWKAQIRKGRAENPHKKIPENKIYEGLVKAANKLTKNDFTKSKGGGDLKAGRKDMITPSRQPEDAAASMRNNAKKDKTNAPTWKAMHGIIANKISKNKPKLPESTDSDDDGDDSDANYDRAEYKKIKASKDAARQASQEKQPEGDKKQAPSAIAARLLRNRSGKQKSTAGRDAYVKSGASRTPPMSKNQIDRAKGNDASISHKADANNKAFGNLVDKLRHSKNS